MNDIVINTDSATMVGCLKSTISGVKTKSAAEIHIKRTLGIFKSITEERRIKVDVRLVRS